MLLRLRASECAPLRMQSQLGITQLSLFGHSIVLPFQFAYECREISIEDCFTGFAFASQYIFNANDMGAFSLTPLSCKHSHE